MAENRGHAYEKHINGLLSKFKLHPSGFVPDTGSRSSMDAAMTLNRTRYNLELKAGLGSADFGSASLDYDFKNKKWTTSDKVPEELTAAMKNKGIFSKIEAKWVGVPLIFLPKEDTKQYTRQEMRDQDKKHFPEFTLSMPDSFLEKYYYDIKDCSLIQVKGHGLYRTSKKVTDFKFLPVFNPSMEARFRVKEAGSKDGPGYYSMSFDLQAKHAGQLNKSDYDLDRLSKAKSRNSTESSFDFLFKNIKK